MKMKNAFARTSRQSATECNSAMGEWKRVKLGEICSKIGSGATPTGGKSAYKDDGVSLIRSQNVLDMSFAMAGLAHIDDGQARKLDGVTVYGGDVLLNITGDSVARCCIVPDHVLPARVNQHVCIVRPRPDLAENRFVEYFLIAIKDRLLTLASAGATRNALTKETIQNLEVPLPPLPTQRRIAAVLGALDDKIEVNRKICENLEAQAQALFKAWFVDFEPFGGKRPEGWKMGKLGDVAAITMGQSPDGATLNEDDDGITFYQGRAEFGCRFPTKRLSTTEPKRLAKKGDVLLSVRAPVGDLNIAIEDCCIGRGLAALREQKGCQSYLYYLLKTLKPAFDLYEGAGTIFGSINKDSLHGLDVLLPAEEQVLKFNDTISANDSLIQERERESRALAAMRDALLPKLMSGELAVEKVADACASHAGQAAGCCELKG